MWATILALLVAVISLVPLFRKTEVKPPPIQEFDLEKAIREGPDNKRITDLFSTLDHKPEGYPWKGDPQRIQKMREEFHREATVAKQIEDAYGLMYVKYGENPRTKRVAQEMELRMREYRKDVEDAEQKLSVTGNSPTSQ